MHTSILALLVILESSALPARAALVKDTTYTDLKKSASKVNPDGRSLTFDSPVNISIRGTLLQAKGTVTFHKDTGTVSSIFSLQNTATFHRGGRNVTFRSWISFDNKGRVTFGIGARDAVFTVGKYTVRYRSTTPKGMSAKMFFYPNGNVSDIHIYDDHTLVVGGKSYTFAHQCGCGGDLQFYADGRLKGGYLAQATTIDGRLFKKGDHVQFSELGRMVLPRGKIVTIPDYSRPAPKKTTTFFSDVKHLGRGIETSQKFHTVDFPKPVDLYTGGRLFRVKGKVYFHKYTETVWNIENLLKADPVTVGGHTITFRKYITFSERGQITFGYPTRDITFSTPGGTIAYKTSTGRKDANLSFFPSGRLEGLQLAANQKVTVGGRLLEFAPRFNYFSHDLGFHPNGRLRYGYVAADTTIDGKRFSKGSKVEFTDTGALATH